LYLRPLVSVARLVRRLLERSGGGYILSGFCQERPSNEVHVRVRLRIDAGQLQKRQPTAGSSRMTVNSPARPRPFSRTRVAFLTRMVAATGRIRWNGVHVTVNRALQREWVGIERRDGVHQIYFAELSLGLYPLAHPEHLDRAA
jgi:hypothetical protein